MSNLLSYDMSFSVGTIPSGDLIAVDTETTGLNPYKGDRAFLFSFANEEGDISVVPRTLKYEPLLNAFFADKSITKIFHNCKFDMKMCRQAGFPVKGKVHDTLVMSRLVDENAMSHRLKLLCKKYFGYKHLEDDLVDKYKLKEKVKSYEEIPTDILYPYAAVDAWNCMLLYNLFQEPLSVMRKAYAMDMKCTLYSMQYEDKGVLVDKKLAREVWKEYKVKSEKLSKKVKALTGCVIGPDDSRTLGYALFAAGEKCIQVSDAGAPVLDKHVLPQYEAEFVPHFIEMRKISKIATSIKNHIIDACDDKQVLHPSFNQSMARTRRASCSKPNFQQVDKKSRIREIFIPRPGHYLFYFDYSQIEYRLFAHFGKDPELVRGYCDGTLDAHDLTAQRLGVDRDGIAKTLNFAVLYGSGANGLTKLLKKDHAFCNDLLQKFHASNPSLKELQQRLEYEVAEKGYIEDPYGMHYHVLADDMYKIVNTLMQGCAGSVLKMAKLDVKKLLKKARSYLIGEIHDELIIEVPHDELYIVPLIKETMEDLETFSVPLLCNVQYTKTHWGAKEDFPLEEATLPW